MFQVSLKNRRLLSSKSVEKRGENSKIYADIFINLRDIQINCPDHNKVQSDMIFQL
jgi:hypothetical protein